MGNYMLKFDKKVERFRKLLAEKISGSAELTDNAEYTKKIKRVSGLNCNAVIGRKISEFDDRASVLREKLSQEALIKEKKFVAFGKRAVLFYSDGLTDVALVDRFIVEPLLAEKARKAPEKSLILRVLPHVEITFETDFDSAILKVFDGDCLVLLEGAEFLLSIGSKKWDKRTVAEPPTSSVIKGPREGFTEDLMTNISLIKRKLKTPALKFLFCEVGRYSRSKVAIVFIDEIADQKVVSAVKKRIDAIDIDGVLDSSYLKEHLKERKLSIFRQIGDTEKPDILSSKLLEGRIGIVVDGSPIVLTTPYMLLEDFQGADDYYSIPYAASFLRVIRFLSMLVGILMPGFYVAAQSFHLQFIPLRLVLTIASAVKGIPLSANIEMLFTLFIFELLNEASIRMPRYVGMALSIVGALVLGDTAVRAGIVSTPTILIMALSGIAVYAIPDERNTLSILRLLFLLLSGSLGLIGLVSGTVVVTLYLATLSSYGTPYLAPFAPKISNDLSDGLLKSPYTVTNERPNAISNTNGRRISWKK